MEQFLKRKDKAIIMILLYLSINSKKQIIHALKANGCGDRNASNKPFIGWIFLSLSFFLLPFYFLSLRKLTTYEMAKKNNSSHWIGTHWSEILGSKFYAVTHKLMIGIIIRTNIWQSKNKPNINLLAWRTNAIFIRQMLCKI